MAASAGRSKTVTFLGWFNATAGALCVVASFAAGANAIGLLMAGIISLVVGVGLLRGQRWVWGVAVVGYGLNLAGGIVKINPITAVVSGLVLVYLYSMEVRAAYAGRPLSSVRTVRVQEDVDQKKVA